MKLVIISDIHDNRLYLEKCRAYCLAHAIEAILCTGDICDEETLERLDDFNIPVYVIRGNGDFFEDSACDSLKHVTCLGRTGEVTLENKKIGLCHEPYYIKEILPNNYDILFFGHTHKPWIETRGSTLVINPGCLSGHPAPSTFAVWDTSQPEPELLLTDQC